MDGIEALKKYKNLPPRVRTEGTPVFEDGDFKGVESPSRVGGEKPVIVKEDCSTVEKRGGSNHKQEIDNPGEHHESFKPGKRTCQYCDTQVYNSQTICDKCKEKRFQEIWTEILDPLLEKQGFFIKKDVMEIDFPMTLHNSLSWYIKNNYLTLRKNGKINEYYIPTPEEIQEKEVPGITKRCRDCEKIKPVTEFYKQKRSPDGYSYICKTCDKKRNQNRPRIKKEPDLVQHLQELLVDDMQRQLKKNRPIRIHLFLLEGLENFEDEKE
jgi:hypothetical protein